MLVTHILYCTTFGVKWVKVRYFLTCQNHAVMCVKCVSASFKKTNKHKDTHTHKVVYLSLSCQWVSVGALSVEE